MYMPYIKFQDSSIGGSQVSKLLSITDRQMDGQTDGCTDRRTDRPKPICPLNFSEVGGIKRINSYRKEFALTGANSFFYEFTLIETISKTENARVCFP